MSKITMKSLNRRLAALGHDSEIVNKYRPGCETKSGGFTFRYYLDGSGYDTLAAVEQAVDHREIAAIR